MIKKAQPIEQTNNQTNQIDKKMMRAQEVVVTIINLKKNFDFEIYPIIIFGFSILDLVFSHSPSYLVLLRDCGIYMLIVLLLIVQLVII
jgi:hypothetical protein